METILSEFDAFHNSLRSHRPRRADRAECRALLGDRTITTSLLCVKKVVVDSEGESLACCREATLLRMHDAVRKPSVGAMFDRFIDGVKRWALPFVNIAFRRLSMPCQISEAAPGSPNIHCPMRFRHDLQRGCHIFLTCGAVWHSVCLSIFPSTRCPTPDEFTVRNESESRPTIDDRRRLFKRSAHSTKKKDQQS